MKLVVIIVNYRTADLTLQVVRAVLAEIVDIAARVIVVDNDSQDGSFERLSQAVAAEDLSARVLVLASDKNGGFGHGINVAVRRGLELPERASYFYVLNPDAFPDPGAVRRLVDCLDENPEVGIAGSYIRSTDGRIEIGGFRFPSVFSEFETTMQLGPVTRLLRPWVVSLPNPEQARDVDWVSGVSMMIRREVFETVGLFDEGFFLYFEEIDFCRRVRQGGYTATYVASSKISHIGSVSTGMGDVRRPMPAYWFESRRRYFRKHHGPLYLAACDVLWTVGFSLWRLRRRIQRKPDADKPHMLRDFIRYNFPRSFAKVERR
jgi:N-acetylglucosaminyl-diphospho-decaprenol L-rhamnosyltransferase